MPQIHHASHPLSRRRPNAMTAALRPTVASLPRFPIAERWRLTLAGYMRLDGLGHIASLLVGDRGRSPPGERLARGIISEHRVADNEDVG
jgi:hypothetical protein